MTTKLCESEGYCIAWNAEPLPDHLKLNDLPIADPAICAISPGNNQLDFRALRYHPDDVTTTTGNEEDTDYDLPIKACRIITMALEDDVKDIRWFTKHSAEPLNSQHPAGILAVSTGGETAETSSNVLVYNPADILSAYDNALSQNPEVARGVGCPSYCGLLTSISKPNVTCLDLDRCASNSISLGDTSGVVSFFDLESGQSTGVTIETNQGSMRCLKWHPQTKDVLLGGAEQGFTVLNPKSKKPLISIVDSGGRQNVSGLCWLTTGKSVVVTYDSQPPSGRIASNNGIGRQVVQIWDLRHTNVPYKEYSTPHQKGIIKLEQHGLDSKFFMTGSRDGRCVMWAMTGLTIAPYSEVDVGESIDGFSLSQTDALTSVCVRHASKSSPNDPERVVSSAANVPKQLSWHNVDSHILAEASKVPFAPRWLPSGSDLDFGFGGRLAWFAPMASGQQDVAGISNACSDEGFLMAIDQFAPFLERNDLGGYCEFRAQTEAAEQNAADITNFQSLVWSVIQTQFLPQGEKTMRILQLFGLEPMRIAEEVESYLGHPGGSQLLQTQRPPMADMLKRGMSDQIGGDYSIGASSTADCRLGSGFNATESAFDTENFFSRLAHTVKDDTKCTDTDDPSFTGDGSSGVRDNINNPLQDTRMGTEQVSFSGPGYFVSTAPERWKVSPMKYMKESFMVGDILSSIEIALSTNQFSLAFMLADSTNDVTVKAAVKRRYLEATKDPFVTVLATASDRSFKELVASCDLNDWKGVLAVLLTYLYNSDQSSFKTLCTELGKRLQTEQGDNQAAKLTFLIAGAFQEAAELITTMPSITSKGTQALKLFILATLDPTLRLEKAALKLIHRFVCRLVNGGKLSLAEAILRVTDNTESDSSTTRLAREQLKFMISECTTTTLGPTRPTFDFYDVQPSPEVVAAAAQSAALLQQQQQQQQSQMQSMQAMRPGMMNTGMPNNNLMNLNTRQPPPGGPTAFPMPGGGPPSNPFQAPPLNSPGSIPSFAAPPPPPRVTNPTHGPAPFATQPPVPVYNRGPPPPPMPMGNKGDFGTSGSGHLYSSAPPPQMNNAAAFAKLPSSGGGTGGLNPATMPLAPLPPPPVTHLSAPSSDFGGSSYPPGGINQMPNEPMGRPGPNVAGFRPTSPYGDTLPPPPPPAMGGLQGPPGGPMPTTISPQAISPQTTHPAAISSPLPAGMPTPWPIPTATQQAGAPRVSSANEKLNQQIHQATHVAGVVCPREDIMKIQRGLDACLGTLLKSGGEDPKRIADYQKAVSELVHQLEGGQVTQEVQHRLLDYVEQLGRSEGQAALSSCQSMISLGWNKDSKFWLSTLKRIASTSRSSLASPYHHQQQPPPQQAQYLSAYNGSGASY